MKSEKKLSIFMFVLSVITFFSFGLYHLGKFETVDEHFWKFERVPQYWKAVKNLELKKTRINDKPGVSTAIISGFGLFFENHPEEIRVRDSKQTNYDLLTLYNWKEAEKINLFLRFPLLLFNSLFLIFFWWIIKKITDSYQIAAWTVLLLGFSPILIGISQIINPDTLLWTFTAAGIFSYFALLKKGEKKFIILTALFTGLSLLSKYSANILFPAYILIFLLNYIFDYKEIKSKNKEYFSKNIIHWVIIYAGSIAVFSLLMPAVFKKIKHLYYGTIGAPGFSMIFWPMMIFILVLTIDTFLLKNIVSKKIGEFLNEKKSLITSFFGGILLLIFSLIIINCWTNQKAVPFDQIRDLVYQHQTIGFGGILEKDNFVIEFIKELLIEFYPFVFSQSVLSIIILFYLWIKMLGNKIERYQLYILFISIFSVIYFISLLFANVLANIRYSIILYPLFAFLVALGINEIILDLKDSNKKYAFQISILAIIFFGFISLWQIKPFYFNYANFLLPKQFIITDSWGYGEYEAAQYLNSLPNSENLMIWSDRSAICQFLKSGCIRDYKIDITKTRPDYFVISKRGSIRHKFEWKYPELAKKNNLEYYEDDLINNYVWSIFIDNRPENFIKIIKATED